MTLEGSTTYKTYLFFFSTKRRPVDLTMVLVDENDDRPVELIEIRPSLFCLALGWIFSSIVLYLELCRAQVGQRTVEEHPERYRGRQIQPCRGLSSDSYRSRLLCRSGNIYGPTNFPQCSLEIWIRLRGWPESSPQISPDEFSPWRCTRRQILQRSLDRASAYS